MEQRAKSAKVLGKNTHLARRMAKKEILSVYHLDSVPLSENESLANYGIQLAFFSVVNPVIAEEIYREKVASQWTDEGFWGDRYNYYDQNWVWFGIALYVNNPKSPGSLRN
ncbi:MAG: hypothetical protein NZM26_01405 [Patescibacteria group bacterium]|nr:hypothetical protein [Patescibacteria group bacterium]